MKRFNPIIILIAAVVAITAVGCTTSQYVTDEELPRHRQAGNRVYIDDPYAGTIVLERDPYTGRYYDVTYGYGGYYGYSPYGRYSPYYRNYSRYPRTVIVQQPAEEQRRNYERSREDARKKVFGNN